jgi:hypothetical protein
MYIQYAGFNLIEDSRTYIFHVINPPGEAREFTVSVLAKEFGFSPLKIQDGPAISTARLKRELDRETPELPAEASLLVGERDIQEYVQRIYPKPVKRAFGDRS